MSSRIFCSSAPQAKSHSPLSLTLIKVRLTGEAKNVILLVGHDHSVITAGVLNGPFTWKDFSNEVLEAVRTSFGCGLGALAFRFWCFSRITAGG